MKRRVQTPCGDCGTPCWGTRCARCYNLTKPPPLPRRKGLSGSWAERKRRAAVVRAHRENFGDWCPGWGREPHVAIDLCADHLVPVAAGGDEHGPLTILCRGCNSRKRDRLVDPRRASLRGSRAW